MGKHLATEIRGGVTVVTARDGLFDAIPEMAESVPIVAEVVDEFRSAIAGRQAVVVDLRRAGEVNKRTLSVAFQLARALTAIGARRALCGSTDLKQIWDLCKGGTIAPCLEDFQAAVVAAGGTIDPAEPDGVLASGNP
jgi:hypothetical protein